jgi:hypothetical protein
VFVIASFVVAYVKAPSPRNRAIAWAGALAAALAAGLSLAV